MPQPYNYIIDASAPDNRVFETIQGMRGMRDERLLQERAMAESQAASQALQELGRTKHIGASQINQFKIAHPNYHKQFTDVLDSLGEQTKGSVRSSILKIKMLDKSGRHEEAKAEAKRIAKAHENSGNDEGSGLFNTLASSMEADKEGTSGLIDVVGAEMLGDDYYKALDQASVTPVNVAKTEAETAAKVGEEKRAEGMAEISDMDDDAKKLFVANDKELAMNNEEARKLDSLSARMISEEDGKPIEFGGAPETYMRKFKQFWTGMSDDDPQKDLLIKELKGVALSAAFKLKQAGAMSDPEFNQYISTVPTANDSEKIVGPWISNVINNNKKAFAALTISNKFLEANGSAKSAKEKFIIDIDGKKITVNEGNSVQTILRKVGQKLADFAPSIGGSEANKGKGSQSLTDEKKKTLDEFMKGN